MKLRHFFFIALLGITSGISAQEISYNYDFFHRSMHQNGVPLTWRTLDSVTAKVPEAHQFIKKAKHRNTWATLLNVAAAGCIAYPAIQEIGGHDAHWEVGYVGVGLMAINFPIIISREKQLKKGIAAYNSALQTTYGNQKPKLYWGFKNYQVGVALVW